MSATPESPALLRPGFAPVEFSAASTVITAMAEERPVCGVEGDPLPAGSAIELGYFSRASIHDLFAGTWIALLGIDAPAANRSTSLIFCGSGGELPGRFSWCRTFFAGIDALPPTGRPLALRIYDHTNTADAFFSNTVSHPAWWFREPRTPSPAFVFMSLDEPNLRWESGPEGAFRTVLRIDRGALRWKRVFRGWRRGSTSA